MTDEEKVNLRIACPALGYPESEAKFKDEADFWEWYFFLAREEEKS